MPASSGCVDPVHVIREIYTDKDALYLLKLKSLPDFTGHGLKHPCAWAHCLIPTWHLQAMFSLLKAKWKSKI